MDYVVARPLTGRVPVLLSIPHCGTAFPDAIKNQYDPELVAFPEDTDWYVDRLYSFAPSIGITVISAVWSRWVVDLNRDPGSKPLYTDGRIITDLCPATTFLGQPLYKDGRRSLSAAEIDERKTRYFDPYHKKLGELLYEIKSEFGKVLLWDCHSIRQHVPTISADRFPDLVLGSVDGKSADRILIDTALKCLGSSDYSLLYNHPFKGGYITRHYGEPERAEHALQLEMSKINYMNDLETRYDDQKSKKMETLLRHTLSSLVETLYSLKD